MRYSCAAVLRISLALVSVGVFTFACGDDTSSAIDAALSGDAQQVEDAGGSGDSSVPGLAWVDFAISGCPSGDGTEESPCIGPSPLHLSFTLLAPGEVSTQLWNFGDGSEASTSLNPEHSFTRVGSYDLRLDAEGPGGSAGTSRLAAVVVIPAPVGSTCSSNEQCASDLCLCGDSENCSQYPGPGICSLPCESKIDCGANGCIQLTPEGDAPELLEDWQGNYCLALCQEDSDCFANQSCQFFLNTEGNLQQACLAPGLLAPIGGSCLDSQAQSDNSRCASGDCRTIGLRGMCTLDCVEGDCPEGSVCATFSDFSICLADCEDFACDGDPLLSCQAPAEFSIQGPPSDAGYCAPTPLK